MHYIHKKKVTNKKSTKYFMQNEQIRKNEKCENIENIEEYENWKKKWKNRLKEIILYNSLPD